MRKIYLFTLLVLACITGNSFAQTTYTIGTGTGVNTATTYPSPYGNYYGSSKHQFLITKAELNAAGLTGASQITSLAFNVKTVSGGTMNGYTVSLLGTAATALANAFVTGLSTVYGPVNYTDVVGWNTHTFSTPFCWDGNSNIVVQTCFYDPSFTNNSIVYNSTVAANMAHHISADGADQCPIATGGTLMNLRPNMQITASPSGIDAAITAINSPIQLSLNSGSSNTVNCTFANRSCSGNITSATLNYQWNSGTVVSQAWTGTLAPQTTTTVNFTTPLIASPTGVNTLKVWVTSPNGLASDANAANNLISEPVFVKTTIAAPTIDLCGNDYWFSLEDAGGNAYNLIINSAYCVKGKVDIPGLNYTQNFTTTNPNTTLNLTIPQTASGQNTWTDANDVIQGKGIHVYADYPFTCQVVPYASASVDGDFYYPSAMLGQEYVVGARTYGNINAAYYTVGATQNNTTVLIGNRVTGLVTSITLNQGQTYRQSSNSVLNCNSETNITNPAAYPANCSNLTGSYIVSDKPVYVTGFTPMGNLGVCGAADFMCGYHLPVNLWSSQYITGQSIKRNNPSNSTCLLGAIPPLPAIISSADFVEIIGPTGTTVTITRSANIAGGGTYTATIPAGPFGFGYIYYLNPRASAGTAEETAGACNMVIKGSNPIEVIQYSQGWQTDNQNFTDPEMIYVYPESFWQTKYMFGVYSGLTSTSSSVVALAKSPTGAAAALQTGWNGTANFNGPGWVQIGASSYFLKRVNLTAGGTSIAQTNTSNIPFGIYANVVGAAESYTVNMQGGCSNVVYPVPTTCPTVLPVYLRSFEGKNKGTTNDLVWLTETETNFKNFVLERSNDLVNFKDIASIPGSGNSSTLKKYTYTDTQVPEGVSYYRLRIVDFDGQSEHSNFLFLSAPVKQINAVTLNYDKADNKLLLSYHLTSESIVVCNVLDITGTLIAKRTLSSHAGFTNEELLLGNLKDGTYIVQLQLPEIAPVVKKIVVY